MSEAIRLLCNGFPILCQEGLRKGHCACTSPTPSCDSLLLCGQHSPTKATLTFHTLSTHTLAVSPSAGQGRP